jgi:hypothetical protein
MLSNIHDFFNFAGVHLLAAEIYLHVVVFFSFAEFSFSGLEEELGVELFLVGYSRVHLLLDDFTFHQVLNFTVEVLVSTV